MIFVKVHFNLLTFPFLWAFNLEWPVVTCMEAEQIIERLANYIWLLKVPKAG